MRCPAGIPELPIIDARSGKRVRLGETISYGDGEAWKLLGVCTSGNTAQALVEGNRIEGGRQWVPMPVYETQMPPPVGVRLLSLIPQTIRYAIMPT